MCRRDGGRHAKQGGMEHAAARGECGGASFRSGLQERRGGHGWSPFPPGAVAFEWYQCCSGVKMPMQSACYMHSGPLRH
eukprot:scaffold7990_cov350-Prasinococcus_capsulatus_cf.AAC.2